MSVQLFELDDWAGLVVLALTAGGPVPPAALAAVHRMAQSNARAFRARYGEEVVPPTLEEVTAAACRTPDEHWERRGATCGRLAAYNADARPQLTAEEAAAFCVLLQAADRGAARRGIEAQIHRGCPSCAPLAGT